MELRSSRSRSRTPFVQLTRLEEQNMSNSITEETYVRRSTRNKTYINSSSLSDEIFEDEDKRRSLRSRCKTSDYSSEEEHLEHKENGVKSALQVYKEAGEYWNKFPKTDYTYSTSSKDRVELAPGVVNMPNMSRKSLRRSMEPAAISSTTSNNYNYNNHAVRRTLNYSDTTTVKKVTIITRIYRSLITLLLMSYSSMENMLLWVARAYYKTASRLFLFDTWLMQKTTGGARKYTALGWTLYNQSKHQIPTKQIPLPVLKNTEIDLNILLKSILSSPEYREQTHLINELKSELNQLRLQQILFKNELNKCCNKRYIINYETNEGVGDASDAQIRKIVHETLAIYDADKTGLVDYALESSGGQIISTRCTENYHSRTAVLSVLGIPLWYPSNTPRVVITPGVTPGECWAFSNFPGFVVVQLSAIIKLSAVSVEHIPEQLAPGGVRDSAPRAFTVWGLMHENDRNPVSFGKFEYKLEGPPLQYFPVDEVDTPVNMVELRVESNHGNMNYTCLYRFRVHGNQT